jgi:hypothetical protein
MACRVDRVVQNVPHNQCTKLHDGSDLGHQLGVSDATFPHPRPTSKAASPTPVLLRLAPGRRWIGRPTRGAGRLRRLGGEVGDPRAGSAAECSSVDAGRFQPAEPFVNSDARCDATQTAVAIGRTPGSLVVICGDPSGRYGYLGVRLSDDAVLKTVARSTPTHEFIARNASVTYSISPTELLVTAGGAVIKQEPMIDYRGPGT